MEQGQTGEQLDNGWYARSAHSANDRVESGVDEPTPPLPPAADNAFLAATPVPEDTGRDEALPVSAERGESAPPPRRPGRGLGMLAGISLLVSGLLVAALLVWNPPASVAAARTPVPVTLTVVVLGAPPSATPAPPTPLPLETAQAAQVKSQAGNKTVITFSGPLTSSVWLAWAPDNRTLALAGNDQLVRLLDTTTGQVTFLPGHTGAVFQVAWSPDGRTLASSGADTTVRLWSPAGQPLTTLVDIRNLALFAWAPSGELTTLATGANLLNWQADGTALAAYATNDSPYSSLAWSPDGQWLAAGGLDKTVRLWQPDGTQERRLVGHTSAVYCVAWSPDSQILAAGADDGSIRLWNRDGELRATLTGHRAFVNSLAWSPDGQTLASAAGDNTVRLWDKAGKPLATLTGHTAAVLGVGWSADGKTLASVAADNTVRLWR